MERARESKSVREKGGQEEKTRNRGKSSRESHGRTRKRIRFLSRKIPGGVYLGGVARGRKNQRLEGKSGEKIS